jgi:tryptophan-rich sensory protein
VTSNILLAVIWGVVVAAGGAFLTDLSPWYFGLRRPPWQPPDWLFGPAWTIIFILEAASAVIGWQSSRTASDAALLIGAYVANGLLNMLWSLFFFTWKRPDWALYEVGFLWLSIIVMMAVLHQLAGLAWLLLLPYLLWVSFASFLTGTIVRLNAPFRVTA